MHCSALHAFRCPISQGPADARVIVSTGAGPRDYFDIKAKTGLYRRVASAGASDGMLEGLVSGTRPCLTPWAFDLADWSFQKVNAVSGLALTSRAAGRRNPLVSV